MVSVALAAALALNPLSPLAPYGGVTAEAATYPGWPDNGVFQTSVPEEFNSAKLMNKMSETRLDSNDGWGVGGMFSLSSGMMLTQITNATASNCRNNNIKSMAYLWVSGMGKGADDWSATFEDPDYDDSWITDDVMIAYLFPTYSRVPSGGFLTLNFGSGKTYVYSAEELRDGKVRTEWVPYVGSGMKGNGLKAVFTGSGRADERCADILLADLTSPGEDGWEYSVTTEDVDGNGGSSPVLWLKADELLRTSKGRYERTDRNSMNNMKLKLGIVPKSDPTAELAYVTAVAQGISADGSSLGFQIEDSDWSEYQGQEYQIITVTDATDYEGKWYTVYAGGGMSYHPYVNTGANVNVTDLAGNGVYLEGLKDKNVRAYNLILDMKAPKVSRVKISGSAVDSSATTQDPDQWPEDIDRTSLFSKAGDTVQFSLQLNEQVIWPAESEWENIILTTNLIKDGTPVTAALTNLEDSLADGSNGNIVTTLTFETVTITDDMEPQGGRIRPVSVSGLSRLNDYSENAMDDSADLSADALAPNIQNYLDTNGPTAEIGKIVSGEKNDTEANYIIPFTISDGAAGSLSAGVAGAEGQIALTSYENAPLMNYAYEVTREAAVPESLTKTGTVGGEGNTVWSSFRMESEGNYYLHLKLTDIAGKELLDSKGLNVKLILSDVLGNQTEQDILLSNLQIDSVAPELTVVPTGTEVTRNDAENQVSFTAKAAASDHNGLERIEYQWVEANGNPSNTGWTVISYEDDPFDTDFRTVEPKIVTGTSAVSRDLVVRAYDKHGNMTEKRISMSANLARAMSQYTVSGNPDLPANDTDIMISRPVSTDENSEGSVPSTSAVVVMGDKTYVRVIRFDGNTSDPVSLMDKEAADWYQVSIENGVYTAVTQNSKPDWNSYYGDVQVTLYSSLTGDLIPNVGKNLLDQEDTTVQQDTQLSLKYASANNDVYSVAFGAVEGADGAALEPDDGFNSLDACYLAQQSMAGMRYPFTLSTDQMPAWGFTDLNFADSYAVLIALDTNGKVQKEADGSEKEVSVRMPLSRSSSQVFSIPAADKDGNAFSTGAYSVKVHVAQNQGGAKDFYATSKIVLDASKVPDKFGVLDTNSEDLNVKESLSIGVAQWSRFDVENGSMMGQTEKSATVVELGGRPAYVLDTQNSLDTSADNIHRFSFDLSVNTEDLDTQSWLGYTTGQITGIRYWNAASAGDPSTVDYTALNTVSGNRRFLTVSGIYNYKPLEADEITPGRGSTVVTADALKACDVSDFRLALGSNTICYQLQMENGATSPVYQTQINLITEAPSVELEYDLGPGSLRQVELYGDGGYDYRRYVDYIDVKLKNVFSPNGGVKIYHVKYNQTDKKWESTKVSADDTIRLTTAGNGYFGAAGIQGSYQNIYEYIRVEDSVGNAVCAYPITTGPSDGYDYDEYYYIIDSSSQMDIGYADRGDGSWEVDLKTNYYLDWAVDSVALQIDDRSPVALSNITEWIDDKTMQTNPAGMVKLERLDGYSTGNYGAMQFVFPYDSDKAEGEMLKHTVTASLNGFTDSLDKGSNTVTKTFTVSAPNTKPTVSLSGEPSQLGKVGVVSNTYVREVGSTGEFSKEFYIEAYKNGEHELTVEDPYGQQYTMVLNITDMPEDPTVTVSTKAYTPDPVTVTAESTLYDLKVDTNGLPAGTEMTGNGSKKLVLTVPENGSFHITYTDNEGQEVNIPVTITNIYNAELDPQVIWSYDTTEVIVKDAKIDEETGEIIEEAETKTVIYGNVTAFLADENGSELIDPRTGDTPKFTFVPGGQTEYTFSGYVNEYGIAGADVTASVADLMKSLGLEQTELIQYPSETEEEDKYRPDLALNGWAIRGGISAQVKAAYLDENSSRPEDSTVGLIGYDAYGQPGTYEDYTLVDRAEDLLKKMGWADSYLFNVDIADETAVRLFVKAGETAAVPDYADGTSDEIEGVTLQGRMLQVDKNTDFTLFAVDENNNSTSVYLNITNLGGLPEPNYAQVLDKDGYVRIYLMPPNLEGVTELQITNDDNNDKIPDAQIQEDEKSLFYGFPYLTVKKNGSVRVYYSYAYEGYTNTGYIDMEVAEIDTNPPVAVEQTWSANYDPEGKNYTNQEISLQIEFDKKLENVEIQARDGIAVTPDTGLSVSWMENRATVVFENNIPEATRLYVKASNGQEAVVDIPAVTTIDKITPEISAEISGYAPNHRSAEVTVTVNETGVILQETGETGTESKDNTGNTVFTETVKENGTFTYTVADKAGNKNHTTVTVSDLVTEPLSLELSRSDSDSSIIDPETYQPSIGDTLYARTNRASDISVNGNTEAKVSAAAGTWVPVTIAEDSEGLYPSVRAVDAYGNAAVVQLLRIPMGDRTAPVVLTVNSLISASRDTTEEELGKLFRSNLICSDDTTAADQLTMEFAYDRSSGASKVPVSYTVKDAAGNSAKGTFWLRLYGGDELRVTVNGQDVTWDETVLLDSRVPEIIVYSNGERYKVDMKAGIKTAAQLKTGAVRVSGYTDREENELKVTLDESGYYTFCITTQGRTIYRFVLYVED